MLAGDPGHPVPDDLDRAPDLVATLLGRLVDELPDDQHRLVIELACLSRVTTRSLLRELCDRDRADELLDWLAAQPWVDRLPGGLCPMTLTNYCRRLVTHGVNVAVTTQRPALQRVLAKAPLGTFVTPNRDHGPEPGRPYSCPHRG
jgi:hypothetical protein